MTYVLHACCRTATPEKERHVLLYLAYLASIRYVLHACCNPSKLFTYRHHSTFITFAPRVVAQQQQRQQQWQRTARLNRSSNTQPTLDLTLAVRSK